VTLPPDFEEGQEPEHVEPVIRRRFGTVQPQQVGVRAAGSRNDMLQPPAIVRREAAGGGRVPQASQTTMAPFYGSNMGGGHGSMDETRAMMDGRRAPADAVRPSRFPGRTVARPSLGRGHKARTDSSGPRELELPTFIRRLEA